VRVRSSKVAADGVECFAVDFGRGRLVHPPLHVADPEAGDGRVGVEVQVAWDAGGVARVGA